MLPAHSSRLIAYVSLQSIKKYCNPADFPRDLLYYFIAIVQPAGGLEQIPAAGNGQRGFQKSCLPEPRYYLRQKEQADPEQYHYV